MSHDFIKGGAPMTAPDQGRSLPEWAVSHWGVNGVTYVQDAEGDIYSGPYPTDSEGLVWMPADEDDEAAHR